MNVKVTLDSGRTIDIMDAADVQIADDVLTPSFIRNKMTDTTPEESTDDGGPLVGPMTYPPGQGQADGPVNVSTQ